MNDSHVIKEYFDMLNRIHAAQECDATGDESSNVVGIKK